jgi:very-short-patch-repair endonuclease
VTTGEAVAVLRWQLRAAGEPTGEQEHRFHPVRRWRFDLAFPAQRVAVEVDGGAWVGGRHTSGAGFSEDCIKLSTAAAFGWRVLRFTPRQVHDGDALALVIAALKWRADVETPGGMASPGV